YQQRGIRATVQSDARNTATMEEAYFGDNQAYSFFSVASSPGTFVMGSQSGRLSKNNGMNIAYFSNGGNSGYYIQVFNAQGGSGSNTFYQDNSGAMSWQ